LTAPPPFVVGKPLTAAAWEWAEARHRDQVRAFDQAPFILHPLEVAALLSGRGFDDEVVAAGLLHDVVENTDTSIDAVATRFGKRVAGIVAALTEDPAIASYEARKARLREQVAVGGLDALTVYTADKVVKARELRAEAAHLELALDDPGLRQRLRHYEDSLAMLAAHEPEPPLLQQFAFELWALKHLPPQVSQAGATRPREEST
jgi:HD domain